MKKKQPLFLSLSFCLTLAFTAAHAGNERNALMEAIPNVTTLATESCPPDQNRLLASVGLGEMACTLSRHLSFESLGKAIGINAFQPDSRTNPLNPSDKVEDFVRYNPDFFNRINELYLHNPDFFLYGFIYKHLMADSARIFYITGHEMHRSKHLSTTTLESYRKAAAQPRVTNPKWVSHCKAVQKKIAAVPATAASYSATFQQCGKSGTAALFWYRRQLDGSHKALFTLLDNILKTQDAGFRQQVNQLSLK